LVIWGSKSTVRVAAFVAAVPKVLVKTARYSVPFARMIAGNVRVVDVAPGMLNVAAYLPRSPACRRGKPIKRAPTL